MSAVLQTQTRALSAGAESAPTHALLALNATSLRERFSAARRSGQRARDAAESLA